MYSVFQVQTKLENPTKYHVIQKQKSQVKQYLSESFQHPNGSQFISQPRQMGIQQHSAPGLTNNFNNDLPITPSYTSGLIGHSQPVYTINNAPSASPDIALAISPALSSAATSASEVSTNSIIFKQYSSIINISKFQNNTFLLKLPLI